MPGLVDAQLAMYQGATILAQAEPEPPEGAEFGKASPIGIPVVLLLLIITIALVWNMNSRLKNLPASFDPEDPEADQLVDEGTDRSGVVADPEGDEETGDAEGAEGNVDTSNNEDAEGSGANPITPGDDGGDTQQPGDR